MAEDLLFEIGCEELPASFVEGALNALPELLRERLAALRLDHGGLRALGTPRRIAVIVPGLASHQPDLEEELVGPPVSAAFKEGKPTKAAEAFAQKVGVSVEALERVATPKGEYLRGVRREKGRATVELLPAALTELVRAIPFRKSMRWGSTALAWGRPIRWFVALYGGAVVPFSLEGIASGATTFGHRFLSPGPIALTGASDYVEALRRARVLVDPAERRQAMLERLHVKAKELGGELIDDPFLVGENLSLVEDPQVVAGSFESRFLEIPEGVILEVARGHQRYFGVRGADGKLLPRYLAVVNTAEAPELIVRGNDRVMRARLSDAHFFLRTDKKQPLASRRDALRGVVFQNKLGTMLEKAERIESLAGALGAALGAGAEAIETARRGAHLAKCDLVTLMVGEFPELQGSVGRSYASAEGVESGVADVIEEHYRPKGAHDEPARDVPAALVAMADRLDTLVGCFGIGLKPSGTADPYALRRACLGVLRTALARGLDLRVSQALVAARTCYVEQSKAVAGADDELGTFFRDRLKGLLVEIAPADAVEAALGVAADRPLDAQARALAIAELDGATRAKMGEVFKRATNIAKEAPDGAPTRGGEPAEARLYDRFFEEKGAIEAAAAAADYATAFARIGALAPALADFFQEVLVMADDPEVRANRLRLMRAIGDTCSGLARLEVLAVG
ncbi:MAG: glycine--tRNA ligase subunit beta [Deltaproteobacteria bacterium]|nr:glycine--tRNA ligase subunit beta [Deltaproteobacteria bacterium]